MTVRNSEEKEVEVAEVTLAIWKQLKLNWKQMSLTWFKAGVGNIFKLS